MGVKKRHKIDANEYSMVLDLMSKATNALIIDDERNHKKIIMRLKQYLLSMLKTCNDPFILCTLGDIEDEACKKLNYLKKGRLLANQFNDDDSLVSICLTYCDYYSENRNKKMLGYWCNVLEKMLLKHPDDSYSEQLNDHKELLKTF